MDSNATEFVGVTVPWYIVPEEGDCLSMASLRSQRIIVGVH
jgi:hypothetical protein